MYFGHLYETDFLVRKNNYAQEKLFRNVMPLKSPASIEAGPDKIIVGFYSAVTSKSTSISWPLPKSIFAL